MADLTLNWSWRFMARNHALCWTGSLGILWKVGKMLLAFFLKFEALHDLIAHFIMSYLLQKSWFERLRISDRLHAQDVELCLIVAGGLKDFEFQIGFTLRMWNCVSFFNSMVLSLPLAISCWNFLLSLPTCYVKFIFLPASQLGKRQLTILKVSGNTLNFCYLFFKRGNQQF